MKPFKNKLAVTIVVLSVAFLGIIIFSLKNNSNIILFITYIFRKDNVFALCFKNVFLFLMVEDVRFLLPIRRMPASCFQGASG